MVIEKGKIIELENNEEYYILDSVTYNKSIYLYAVNINNKQQIGFFLYKDECLYPVTDDKISQQLLFIVTKQNI